MEKLVSRASLCIFVCAVGGCGGSTERCSPIDDPGGLWSRAALVRVDVYGAGTHCAGATVAGGGPLLTSRTFSTGAAVALDLPAGQDAIVLTLFADAAGTQPLGGACTEGEFAAGSSTCLALSLQSVAAPGSDGGACDGGGDCHADGGAPGCCDRGCVDTASDVANCGACGVQCSNDHATPSCEAGACVWQCESGYAHCGSGNTGCETRLAQAGLKLCDGACVPASSCCVAADCTSPPGPAACYTAACSSAGACIYTVAPGVIACGATCCQSINGTCAADCSLACNGGFADCDSDPSNGCEQSLSTPSYCGGCFNVCSFPGGIAACPTGSCVLAGCKPGFANCDGQGTNGCECAGTSCCAGACENAHSNGLGQSYYDCTAPGTYNAQQALEACAAFTGDASQCHAVTCSTGDLAACSDGSPSACDCWIYSGSLTSRVKTGSKGSCSCSSHPNLPTWN